VIGRDEILRRLRETDRARLRESWAEADRVRRETVGDEVHLRGLIDIGNVCVRRCLYCGIRAGAPMRRYRMSREEVLAQAALAKKFGYGTLVLQSGEDPGIETEGMARLLVEIKDRYGLAVTVSLGERPLADYRRFREAGADRVLLKFESSNPDLYRRIHPPLADNEPSRPDQLRALRDLGYEIGSGAMIGVPGQTFDILARDLLLFAALDLDMIGIGPYIPHPATPLGQEMLGNWRPGPDQVPNSDLMTLNALALTRLLCPQANIPATTALVTVSATGYADALNAGANVIMPNLTPAPYASLYEIYPKPLPPGPEAVHAAVLSAIAAAGRRPGSGRGGRGRKS
jgi:biotin synthase